MRNNIFLLIILSLIAMKSCYYVDSSTYIVDVSYDSIPEITFTTNLDTIDSIVMYDSLLFTYSIDIDSTDLYAADLYLENIWIFSSGNPTDSFWIGPYPTLPDDLYNFSFNIAYKTNTGSLADIYDLENAFVSREWQITFNTDSIQ